MTGFIQSQPEILSKLASNHALVFREVKIFLRNAGTSERISRRCRSQCHNMCQLRGGNHTLGMI